MGGFDTLVSVGECASVYGVLLPQGVLVFEMRCAVKMGYPARSTGKIMASAVGRDIATPPPKDGSSSVSLYFSKKMFYVYFD